MVIKGCILRVECTCTITYQISDQTLKKIRTRLPKNLKLYNPKFPTKFPSHRRGGGTRFTRNFFQSKQQTRSRSKHTSKPREGVIIDHDLTVIIPLGRFYQRPVNLRLIRILEFFCLFCRSNLWSCRETGVMGSQHNSWQLWRAGPRFGQHWRHGQHQCSW